MEIGIDLSQLMPADLPHGREAVEAGRELARGLERAPSLYCEEKGVGSEREWREIARERGVSCSTMNIGLNTWADTRVALENIYESCRSRGVRPPDRFNLIAERRMGLPKDLRASAPAETGPALWTDDDWWELTHTVPIQPEAADNMIGGPGSVENVLDALRVGVTYVGVLSQYSWRWPYWDDEITQLQSVLTAGGVLAAFRDEGVVFDSYLEDGYPGVFHDYASYIGWAMLERYVSEELIGAAYSSSWGGLTQNPVIKSAVTLALDAVNPDRVPTAFLQGDTIGNTPDFDANYGVLVNDLLFMKLTDMRYRLGGAPIAVPVTETERIPSWDEVATVQVISRKVDEYVPMVDGVIDWKQIEDLRDRLVTGGRHFFATALSTMKQMGVDITCPARVLLVLKRLGAAKCEELFAPGERDDNYLRGHRPVLETDLVRETNLKRDELIRTVGSRTSEAPIRGMKIVVASTDVHEFAKFLLTSTFEALDVRVIDCGINRDPEDVVKVVAETAPEAVVLTTHNGVARSFATKLMEELRTQRLSTSVFMGGVLNEDVEGADVPVDVRDDLRRLGVEIPASVDDLVVALGELRSPAHQ
jgi:methylmalonyl-CoA mutase cobalamin-binding subunit